VKQKRMNTPNNDPGKENQSPGDTQNLIKQLSEAVRQGCTHIAEELRRAAQLVTLVTILEVYSLCNQGKSEEPKVDDLKGRLRVISRCWEGWHIIPVGGLTGADMHAMVSALQKGGVADVTGCVNAFRCVLKFVSRAPLGLISETQLEQIFAVTDLVAGDPQVHQQLEIQFPDAEEEAASRLGLSEELAAFREFGKPTQQIRIRYPSAEGLKELVGYVNEFWTSAQRQGSSLHEVPYRACFKAALVRFLLERLSVRGESVYDPFMGRGTTLIEAALRGRVPLGCDINPLSVLLCGPRLQPPTLAEVRQRLGEIDLRDADEIREDLLVFYHPETLREICALRKYFLCRQRDHRLDAVDKWIWMTALTRLTGHSRGYFSTYTLPPNQAASVRRQVKINAKYVAVAPRKYVVEIILQKTKELLDDCSDLTRCTLASSAADAKLLTKTAWDTPEIPSDSVTLVVTSPPFLNVVNYAADNWLRCWFAGIDTQTVKLTVPRKVQDWREAMTAVLRELHRVLRPGGHIAFEVGEVRRGKIKLEEVVLPCGVEAGLQPILVVINDQMFTKTSNCWSIENNSKGTNTNRIVLFRKES
jgi:DNA modification methylase